VAAHLENFAPLKKKKPGKNAVVFARKEHEKIAKAWG
jgi:hypothetical protein